MKSRLGPFLARVRYSNRIACCSFSVCLFCLFVVVVFLFCFVFCFLVCLFFVFFFVFFWFVFFFQVKWPNKAKRKLCLFSVTCSEENG